MIVNLFDLNPFAVESFFSLLTMQTVRFYCYHLFGSFIVAFIRRNSNQLKSDICGRFHALFQFSITKSYLECDRCLIINAQSNHRHILIMLNFVGLSIRSLSRSVMPTPARIPLASIRSAPFL
jgi:hypothetical protein